MTDKKTLWIITSEPTQAASSQTKPIKSKGNNSANPWHATGAVQAVQGVKVSVEKLETNMSEFLSLVGSLFKKAEQNSGMQLDEVELSVEITGDGEVKLVGSGVGIEAKGAITLKFKQSMDNL